MLTIHEDFHHERPRLIHFLKSKGHKAFSTKVPSRTYPTGYSIQYDSFSFPCNQRQWAGDGLDCHGQTWHCFVVPPDIFNSFEVQKFGEVAKLEFSVVLYALCISLSINPIERVWAQSKHFVKTYQVHISITLYHVASRIGLGHSGNFFVATACLPTLRGTAGLHLENQVKKYKKAVKSHPWIFLDLEFGPQILICHTNSVLLFSSSFCVLHCWYFW